MVFNFCLCVVWKFLKKLKKITKNSQKKKKKLWNHASTAAWIEIQMRLPAKFCPNVSVLSAPASSSYEKKIVNLIFLGHWHPRLLSRKTRFFKSAIKMNLFIMNQNPIHILIKYLNKNMYVCNLKYPTFMCRVIYSAMFLIIIFYIFLKKVYCNDREFFFLKLP